MLTQGTNAGTRACSPPSGATNFEIWWCNNIGLWCESPPIQVQDEFSGIPRRGSLDEDSSSTEENIDRGIFDPTLIEEDANPDIFK